MKAKRNYQEWRLSSILNTGMKIYYAKRLVFYSNIDEMPVYYWNKYRDTLEGKYLVKSIKPTNKVKTLLKSFIYGLKFLIKPDKYNKDYYTDAWNKLYQQFVDKFGFDDGFKELLELKLERWKIAQEFFIEGADKRDRFLITKFKVLTAQIEEVENHNKSTGKSMDFEAVKVYVDKWIGAPLNDKECSVVQYQYYINEMQKPQKEVAVNGED